MDPTLSIPMFMPFSRLPIEIRLKIWEAALPGPRVVHTTGVLSRMRGETWWALRTNCKVPSVLLASRESRLVALKFYVLSFGFGQKVPGTYFNFNIDILYLRADMLFPTINGYDCWDDFTDSLRDMGPNIDVRQIQNVAIFLDLGYPFEQDCYNLAQILGWFGNIQHLTVVVGYFCGEDDDKGDILLIEPIDVAKTCHNYETFLNSSTREEILEVPLAVDFISPNKFEGTLQSIRQVNRDINQEIQHEDEDFRYVTLGDVPVPQIEYKSTITRGLKSYLDSLREGHRQKIEEENTRALLNSKNSDES